MTWRAVKRKQKQNTTDFRFSNCGYARIKQSYGNLNTLQLVDNDANYNSLPFYKMYINTNAKKYL